MLYDFPQSAFFSMLLIGMAIAGTIATLVFNANSPMFMDIFLVVAAICGTPHAAATIRHFKNTKDPTLNR